MSTPTNPERPTDHPSAPFTLEAHFAGEFPELTTPWRGEDQPEPELAVLNEDLARLLGIEPDWLRSPAGVEFLLGLNPEPTTKMVAQGYAGHQFGQFVPSLGDGRALLLGEIRGTDGVLRDIHLKGSGRTRYSRGADGRAALGPALREYLVSEAMHALGVPTTRALAVVTTGRKIQRDRVLPGAVVVRVATSHIRVGSFQYANITGGIDLTRRLADHAITRHYPQLGAQFPEPGPERYSGFFQQVMDAQAQTVARWMRLGFVHGVLNTDNTLVSGETIDYGPCAFMDRYREDAVFSSIDTYGRYKFSNQPLILGWNLARLAETIIPLFGETPDAGVDRAQELINTFTDRYNDALHRELSAGLGLDADAPETAGLIESYLELMRTHSPDVTTLNRTLSEWSVESTPPTGFEDWIPRWLAVQPDLIRMQKLNPVYVPRNHLVEEALSQAVDGRWDAFTTLLSLVTAPYTRRAGMERYERPGPDGFEDTYMTFCGT